MYKYLIALLSIIVFVSGCSSNSNLTVSDQIKNDMNKYVQLIDDGVNNNKRLDTNQINQITQIMIDYNASDRKLNDKEKDVVKKFGMYTTMCDNYDGRPTPPDKDGCNARRDEIYKLLK